MYSENSLTCFPTLTATSYLSGFIVNSIGVIEGEKLNGQIYFLWSQSIKMALRGFTNLSTQQESMKPQIGKPLLYAAIARDIWDIVKKLYTKRHNACRLYTSHKQIHECKQGTMDITSYFNKLFLIWQEMDLCREIIWDYLCGAPRPKSSSSDNELQNGKLILLCKHCKKPWHRKTTVGSYMVNRQMVRNVRQMTSTIVVRVFRSEFAGTSHLNPCKESR
ncbi:UBN2_3 domain-containing protein [Cucumis melo var. makuwa]|uniref:UBN2_3 domain-containing protein n=1 Tax=Cucumis melo var. makuwa TaxID=1194695 RepID=A0A5A7TFZ8_CUCMM|nr:UBN2_3 domain-containing protein [Cucumis melo var. makuwa]TYK23475.1 UBN2_3 domain-containing protein [Cucumis melo var. makuwa]